MGTAFYSTNKAMTLKHILVTKTFEKQLKRVPGHIENAVVYWIDLVRRGYHGHEDD